MHAELHILQLVRGAAAFLNHRDQLLAAFLKAYEIELILILKIVVDQPFIDSSFTDVVDRSAGVTVRAELL